MEAKINIVMDNAAFEEHPAGELARILRKLATQIEQAGSDHLNLRDINGNTVGRFDIDD